MEIIEMCQQMGTWGTMTKNVRREGLCNMVCIG